MMKRSLFFITITALYLTGCKSNDTSVPDDWPGIGPISISNVGPMAKSMKENSFNLDSKIILPKMGKDVSFVLTTTCSRSLPEASKKQVDYSKKHSSPAVEVGPESLDIIDLIPDEVLIYPESFHSCSFKIVAQNQIGSTDTENLNGALFSMDDSRRVINLSTSSDVNSLYPIEKSAFQVLNFGHKDHIQISNPKILCHSKKLRQGRAFVTETESRSFVGSQFDLPEAIPEYPIEYCIFSLKESSGKSSERTVITKPFKVLNGEAYNFLDVSLEAVVTGQDSKSQIPYKISANSPAEDFQIISLNMTNDSSENINFKLSNVESQEHVYVIDGLNEYKKGNQPNITRFFEPLYSAQPAQYYWTNNQNYELNNIVKVEPGRSVGLDLNIRPLFFCDSKSAPGNLSHTQEIGFVAALRTSASALNFKVFTENEFREDAVWGGNIIEAFGITHLLTDNIPGEKPFIFKETTSFQFFFRNLDTLGGAPFETEFTESAASRAARQSIMAKPGGKQLFGNEDRWNKNGEYNEQQLENIQNYRFSSYTLKNRLSCSLGME